MPANIVQNADGSTSFTSETGSNAGAGYGIYQANFAYNATATGVYVFVANRPLVLKGVRVRAGVVASGACTINFNKVPSGTAPGSGTALLSAALDLNTGIAANASAAGSLVTTATTLALAPGDAIAWIVASGASTGAIGTVSFDFAVA